MSDEKKIQGYKKRVNKNNGFTCVQLHYTADPAKRSDEWKRQARFGMTDKEWNTEFELSWETYSGDGVYTSEYDPGAHEIEDFEPNREYPIILRGWDFGGNHSCIVTQYLRGTLYVIDEYANIGYNTRRIADLVHTDCVAKYGNHFRYVDVIDPSGMWEGKTSTGLACGDVMRELGLDLVPGEQDPTRRVDSVMKLLTTMNRGKPKLQINTRCRMLIAGFKGGYHYPEKETKNQKANRPEKNEYSHIHDALQYVATRLETINTEYAEIDLSAFNGPIYDL